MDGDDLARQRTCHVVLTVTTQVVVTVQMNAGEPPSSFIHTKSRSYVAVGDISTNNGFDNDEVSNTSPPLLFHIEETGDAWQRTTNGKVRQRPPTVTNNDSPRTQTATITSKQRRHRPPPSPAAHNHCQPRRPPTACEPSPATIHCAQAATSALQRPRTTTHATHHQPRRPPRLMNDSQHP